MQLFHFSDDADIEVFVPRPVTVPSPRGTGMEWLNGPLVWAVAEHRQALYLFPRQCPRIVLWCTPHTTAADRAAWFGVRRVSFVCYVEHRWLDALRSTTLYRYELPAGEFVAVNDDWAWVSDRAIEPVRVDPVDDLVGALAGEGAELRLVPSLAPLADVWSTSLHASGIRLRNAVGWPS